METFEYISSGELTIKDSGSLQQFYRITSVLSKTRHVHFTNKEDAAYFLEWRFNYRKNNLALQYNIYSGITLQYQVKSAKTANELAVRLRRIN